MAARPAPDPMRVFDRAALRRNRARAAGAGDAHDFLFDEVAARLDDRLDDIRRGFADVLELGARHGALTRRLAARGLSRVVACDPSPAMTALVVADEDLLPFREESFELVVSAFALHWVNDLPGALVQIRRCLRPDGLFLAALPGGDTLHELRRAFLEAEIETEGGARPRTAPFVDVPDAGALLQRAGFALPVVDSDSLTVTYPDAFALMRDLRLMGEANAALARPRTPTRRRTLLAMAERYRTLFGDAEGRIPATFQILTLTGWAPHASQQAPLRPGSAAARLADALGTDEVSTGVAAGPARRKG